tara:strand:+ start:67 stop:573 length:507 start_codon:yes stop_codon:yes gene_type:complete
LSNKDIVLVGQFGSPIGLNGEIKVNMMTTSFEVFKNLKNYYNSDGTIKWNFKKILYKSNKCVVQIDQYFSREDVYKFKGQQIFSNKKFLPKAKDSEYYIIDLVECFIFLKNKSIIGKVLSVQNFGAGDLLEVNYNNKNIFIPFNKTNILSVNINKKEIIADPISGILD